MKYIVSLSFLILTLSFEVIYAQKVCGVALLHIGESSSIDQIKRGFRTGLITSQTSDGRLHTLEGFSNGQVTVSQNNSPTSTILSRGEPNSWSPPVGYLYPINSDLVLARMPDKIDTQDSKFGYEQSGFRLYRYNPKDGTWAWVPRYRQVLGTSAHTNILHPQSKSPVAIDQARGFFYIAVARHDGRRVADLRIMKFDMRGNLLRSIVPPKEANRTDVSQIEVAKNGAVRIYYSDDSQFLIPTE